jgi:hypothetical protein
MISLFQLTSSNRRVAPLAWTRLGEVRPAARFVGVYDAERGRAP